jgi:hypothetical protein
VELDWSTAIITGAAEEPLGLGILGQERSGGVFLVGGVWVVVVGLVCRQEAPFSHSFEMEQRRRKSPVNVNTTGRKWARVVIR